MERTADSLETLMRERVRATLEALVEEELAAALGADRSARVGAVRQGYRHGTRPRTLTTSLGPTTLAMPRARIHGAGTVSEWRSQLVPRYQRRTRRVDEAVLGVYLAGTNTRRIKAALAPLLRGGPLSKDAISRLVGRLREDFQTWRTRDLAGDQIRYLFLDGWYPKVRLGKQRVRVPVLVTLGVRADGQRVVLDLRLVGDESAAAWSEVVASLVARHLPAVLFECVACDNATYVEDCLRTMKSLQRVGYRGLLLYDNVGNLMGRYSLSDLSPFQNCLFCQLTGRNLYYFDILVMKDEDVYEWAWSSSSPDSGNSCSGRAACGSAGPADERGGLRCPVPSSCSPACG